MNLLTGELILRLEDGKQISVKVKDLVDENSPLSQPAEPAVKALDPSQKQVSQQSHQSIPENSVATSSLNQPVPEPSPVSDQPVTEKAAEGSPQQKNEEKQKRKKRNRRSSHRKQTGQKPNKPTQE
jgi:hypothetical protein